MREPMFPSPLKAILATASPASGWAQACPRGRASAPRFNCLAQNVAASVAHRAAGAPSAVVDRQNAGVIAHAVDHVLTGVLGTRSRELENQMGVVDLLSQDQSIRGMIAEERAQESGIAGVWNVRCELHVEAHRARRRLIALGVSGSEQRYRGDPGESTVADGVA